MRARVLAAVNSTPTMVAVYLLVTAAAGSAVAALEGWAWGDGLWWAVATTTTVGYGDLSPETIAGRALGACTMWLGIFVIGITVGRIASVVIRTRDDWTHEEQEASRDREERMLAALASHGALLRDSMATTMPRKPGRECIPIPANPYAWLTQSQERLGWTVAAVALPAPELRVLVRHRDGDPDAPALRGRVQRVHGQAGQSGAYAWLDMDGRPDVPDSASNLVLAGEVWAWREDPTPITERTD